MEDKNEYMGCLVVFLLLITSFFFWPLFFVSIPFGFYFLYSHNEKEKSHKELNAEIEHRLLGLTPQQIEELRRNYIIISQSPFSSDIEKQTAKYIVMYIEDKYWKTNQLKQ
jgi:hypothetical protein